MLINYESMYALKDNLNGLIKKELPFREVRKIMRLLEKINAEIKIIDPLRSKVIEKFSTGVKDGFYVLPKTGEPGAEDFVKEYNEIMSDVVNIDYDKIDVDAIEKALENQTVSGVALMNIIGLNEFYDEEQKALNSSNEKEKE